MLHGRAAWPWNSGLITSSHVMRSLSHSCLRESWKTVNILERWLNNSPPPPAGLVSARRYPPESGILGS